ncbi:MAG: PadR family transcriptional regulator [Candidatus Thermoplasmatota archaeon]|nr:PadR family transcriptional regulator [Candidatus Thermoplasmatota archaeon]
MNPKIPSDLITYLMLNAMEKGPTYGYEIIKNMNAASKGRWKVSYGTVYGALQRLEKKGLIQKTRGTEADRNYFKLTPRGMKSLEKRREQMKHQSLDSIDKIVGFLNVYRSVHGDGNFKKLLDEIRKEFNDQ